MECQVLRENITLQVQVKVDLGSWTTKTVESKKIIFNDCIALVAKHITYSTNTYDGRSGASRTYYYNIVLVSIQNADTDDKSVHKLKLTCPEFDKKEMILYSDDNLWHVLNENSYTSAYKFIMTFHIETLTQINFSSLYDDDQLTDFKLKAHDGELAIHKVILAAVSSKFKADVVKGTEQLNSLDIPDNMSVETLKDFKKCIYTGVLPDENLEKLLLLSSYFKINWLEYKCVDKMMKTMTKGNAINLLEFALEHRHMPLFLGIMDCVQSGTIKMGEIRKQYLLQE